MDAFLEQQINILDQDVGLVLNDDGYIHYDKVV